MAQWVWGRVSRRLLVWLNGVSIATFPVERGSVATHYWWERSPETQPGVGGALQWTGALMSGMLRQAFDGWRWRRSRVLGRRVSAWEYAQGRCRAYLTVWNIDGTGEVLVCHLQPTDEVRLLVEESGE